MQTALRVPPAHRTFSSIQASGPGTRPQDLRHRHTVACSAHVQQGTRPHTTAHTLSNSAHRVGSTLFMHPLSVTSHTYIHTYGTWQAVCQGGKGNQTPVLAKNWQTFGKHCFSPKILPHRSAQRWFWGPKNAFSLVLMRLGTFVFATHRTLKLSGKKLGVRL